MNGSQDEERALTFLTKDLSYLDTIDSTFDVVVIGSGYGAAMATYHLSQCTKDGEQLKICVLERGNEYLDGSFPRDVTEMPGHVRTSTANSGEATGKFDALFDVRAGGDVSSLVANGFGGGSLINAGVMIEPLERVFDDQWPLAYSDLPYQESIELLQARKLADEKLPRKFQELKTIAPRAKPAEITVFDDCNHCGNCATGCNFGHKASLDRTLFQRAKEFNPSITFITGATVEQVKKASGAWEAHIVPTKRNLRKRNADPIITTSTQLILAAGTFGSTELLMKSRDQTLKVSDQLGARFSTNGDMLAVGFDRNIQVNAISRSPTKGNGSNLDVGPTITGVADYRQSDGILLQEMNVPFPIANFFDEIFSTSASVTATTQFDCAKHSPNDTQDPFSLNQAALQRTSVYAMMSDDGAAGEIIRNVVKDKSKDTLNGDGLVSVKWPALKKSDVFKKQIAFLKNLSEPVGGLVIANPLWQPLPSALNFLAGDMEGPLMTVHPLGGCAMAANATQGVVNHLGEVFEGASGDSVHGGLVVLDGSIIPRALGANPALTISAVALRAIRKLACQWHYPVDAQPPRPLQDRRTFRKIDAVEIEETQMQIVERMAGLVSLPGVSDDHILEITMYSEATSPRAMASGVNRRVGISAASYLRLYKKSDHEKILLEKASFKDFEKALKKTALAEYQLKGSLTLFPRDHSTFLPRLWQGLKAHFLNRAVRDAWQALFRKKGGGGSPFRSILQVWAHAGERRTMDYELNVINVSKESTDKMPFKLRKGDIVSGKKTITYLRAANPLRQMSEMAVDQLGSLVFTTQKPVMALQPEFLARVGVPLMRVTQQADSVTALVDFMALAGYVTRMLFSIHALTFRLPDTYQKPPLSRLPDRIPGVANFAQETLKDTDSDSETETDDKYLPAVLTRYEVKGGQPVLMMHGYSASGTTFAHESLPEPFARYLYNQGYDVWLLDARTSPGLPTASEPWAFEEVAETDIPVAIQHVNRVTGQKVNIVAHCMGAGMFSMAILSDKNDVENLIERAVLTQVGPGVVVSPGNVFRAYMLRYIKQFFNLDRFDMRVNNADSLADQLIDRLLNVLPYTDEEFKLENPAWPPWKRTEWVGIRHRMDMLWGETFELENVEEPVLDNIDAMFGNINLDTLSQVIPISKWMNMTNKAGKNEYFQHRLIRKHWCFDTLSLHTAENGLWSPATLKRNQQFFKGGTCTYSTALIQDFGHQDIWLSKRSATEVYPKILQFLKGDIDPFENTLPARIDPRPKYVRPPYLGPIISHDLVAGAQTTILRFAKRPNVGRLFLSLLFEVRKVANGHYESVVPLNDPRWMLKIAHVGAWSSDDPMFRIEKPELPERPHLLLLISIENKGLGNTTDKIEHIIEEALADGTQKGMGEGGLFNDLARAQAASGLSLSQALLEEIQSLLPSIGAEVGEFLQDRKRQVRRSIVEPKRVRSTEQLSLVIGSCQYNAGIIDDNIAYAAYAQLNNEIDNAESPLDLMLLLGDQIYVDATAGLFDPQDQVEAFIEPYAKWLGNKHVRQVMRKLPSYMMLDDHEIDNNWEPGHDKDKLDKGVEAFKDFQFGDEKSRHDEYFYGPIDASPLPLYMLNTRTKRSKRADGDMLGTDQMQSLLTWVDAQCTERPCVISSAAMFLPRHYPLDREPTASPTQDAMDGYPKTLEFLLQMLIDRPDRKFIFLSGDEHSPLMAEVTIYSAEEQLITRTHSVHTSSLYAPYPFANRLRELVMTDDSFPIQSTAGEQYDCRVSVRHFGPASGFTRVDLNKVQGDWVMAVRMSGEEQSIDYKL